MLFMKLVIEFITEFTEDSSQPKPLKSVLKKNTKYQSQPSFENAALEGGDGTLELPGFGRKRS